MFTRYRATPFQAEYASALPWLETLGLSAVASPFLIAEAREPGDSWAADFSPDYARERPLSLSAVQRVRSCEVARVTPFSLSTHELWPGCLEIAIEGELDRSVIDRLQSVLDQAAVERCNVLLDFTACDFIDAAALAVLVHSQQKLKEGRRQLLLHGSQGQVRHLLLKTGLDGGPASAAPPRRTAPLQACGDY